MADGFVGRADDDDSAAPAETTIGPGTKDPADADEDPADAAASATDPRSPTELATDESHDGPRDGIWQRSLARIVAHPGWAAVGALAGIAALAIPFVIDTAPSTINSNNPSVRNGVGNVNGNDNSVVNGNGNVVGNGNTVNFNDMTRITGAPPAAGQAESTFANNVYRGGWGPDRQPLSVNNTANYAVLNTISDNPSYGDERAFVRLKHQQDGDEKFSDLLRASPGDLLQAYVYIQNDCGDGWAKNPLSTLHGLVAVLDTSQRGTDVSIEVQLEAKNAPTVFDGSTVITAQPARLEFVPGSVTMSTGDADFKLDDATFQTTGMFLGQYKQDGEYPIGRTPNGAERGAGYILFQLRVVAL